MKGNEKMFCANCGTKLPDDAVMCPNCGTPIVPMMPETEVTVEPLAEPAPTPVVTPAPAVTPTPAPEATGLRPKGIAIAGFCCAIAAVVCCCLPVPQFLLGVAGLILGILGIKTQKKTMAIIAIVLSAISIMWSIVMAIVYGAAIAAGALSYSGDIDDIIRQFENMF